MKINDLVSIIIPCYNQAQYLEESVQSALDQTYPNIEIIIINDGSSDNTEEIALDLQLKYPEKIKLISQENSGVSEARNNAIHQSKGKYILPLDADDRLDLQMISHCIKSMVDEQADIVYTDLQCFGIRDEVVKRRPFRENHILYKNLLPATSLFRRSVWEQTNGYKANMKEGYEDWEFWINAYSHKFTFFHLPEPLVYYRTVLVSRDTVALQEYHLLLIDKIILNNPELYTLYQVREAMTHIKIEEGLADLYFYRSKDLSINEKHLTKIISRYLSSNELQERQLINIPDSNKKLGLFALDMVEKRKHLKKIYRETEADYILFYASLRYEVPSLQNLDFAWDKERGIIETCGTNFPFVFKSRREDCESQHVAHIHLERYQANRDTVKHEALLSKDVLIKKKHEEIFRLRKIISATERLSVLKHPIKKYLAYKKLLATYRK